ncbi:aminotransferase class V-fold PLP-dependent enzyme [Candidatus Bathyarchaeota archaeon]|nr:aminotransferase class V-fold PLP-dependent enzyme [Candidatus Bathyarchaeota archaeon]
MSVYSKYGVKRVINAAFHLTRLGGSTLSPGVLKAMEEANESYCYMWDLIEKGGEHIAEKVGAEAAWITSGAFNALVLAAAACMAGSDPEKMRRLPRTDGMKDEFIIQRCARLLVYDRSMEVAGGRFVFVGDERWGCTPELIENAITEKTAAIHYAYPAWGNPVIAPLEGVIEVAHSHGVPVIVDAAGWTYPPGEMTRLTEMGCDLVAIGGKYVGGPNSTGFVYGRKDLVDAIALHSFIGAEAGPEEKSGYYRSIGRGYKLDRQEIIGLLTAFDEWYSVDHEETRFKPAWRKVRYIEKRIKKLPGLSGARLGYYPASGEGTGYHTIGLHVALDDKSVTEVNALVRRMREGDPEVWVRNWGDTNDFIINTLNLRPGDEKIIVERFTEVFG